VSLFERVGDLEEAVQRGANAKASVNANVNPSQNRNGDATAIRGRGRGGRIRGVHNRQSSGE